MLGLFDKNEYDEIPYDVVECREHLALSERAAEESFVLLKNDGLLPLKKDRLKTIGVIGPNADSRAALVGNYHGTATEYVTVLEGIRRYVGDDVRIFYSVGAELAKDRTEGLGYRYDRLSEARTVAEHSDVVVLCLGLDETLEGEEGDTGNSYASGDKVSLQLPDSQLALMEAVAGCGKPVVLCLCAGSDIDLRYADSHFNAIVQLWYPGAQGGNAAARMLFGEESVFGKLPVTFYETLEELPEFTDYSMKGRTYRYMEGKAQYPFGYGLNYGNVVMKEAFLDGNQVMAVVENEGETDTEEVIQIYIRAVSCEAAPPNPQLCAFKRIFVKAGETVGTALTIRPEAFTLVGEDGQRFTAEGAYRIYAGFGQPDERTEELTGKKPVVIELACPNAAVQG